MPRHLQIRQAMQARIAGGAWPAHSQLPSEGELAKEFRVSRMTIRQALNSLVDRGLLYRRRGVGTFVSASRMERNLSRLTSFSEDAQARGRATSSQVLSVDTLAADATLAERLALREGTPVIRVRRLRFHDGNPVAVQVVNTPAALCPDLADPAVAQGSVYRHLEWEHGFRLGWGNQTIEARMPTAEEKRLLKMPAQVVLLVVRRTTFLEDGTPVEYTETAYRSDEHIFSITLHRR